jgi:hypothetical protein
MAQEVECLPNKHKTLSSRPSTTKKRKKESHHRKHVHHKSQDALVENKLDERMGLFGTTTGGQKAKKLLGLHPVTSQKHGMYSFPPHPPAHYLAHITSPGCLCRVRMPAEGIVIPG